MFENNINDIEPYWVCIPQASRCAVSNYQMYWYTWDPDKKAAWVRPMPKQDYIIKLENHNFDFYKYKMPQEDFYAEFGNGMPASIRENPSACWGFAPMNPSTVTGLTPTIKNQRRRGQMEHQNG